MSYPTDLLYTSNHEWLKVNGDKGIVGISHFAQSELGDIVYIDITSEGQKVIINQVFGTVEAVKTVSDVYAPVTGTILQFNKNLDSSPGLVNSDCYGEGWMIEISIDKPEELKTLLTSEQYQKIVH